MPTETDAAAFVAIDEVRFSHGRAQPVVDRVSWRIPRGAFHCLVGRSGCGKTTLLKLAAGLLSPDDGRIRVDGRTLYGPDPATGFVFQSPTLLSWLSVLDNVLLPLALKRQQKQGVEKARELLNLLGIGELAERFPHQLSGGQQSRVAIARALIADPHLLLLDEPFAALDALTREQLQDDLLVLCNRQQITALFVTHDIGEAVYMADRVAVMDEGRVIDMLDIDLPRPRTGDIRYGQPFNALSRQLRHAMDSLR